MRYLNELAYSVAKELAPELKTTSQQKGKYFALILNDSCTLTVGDVREISNRVSLKPIFISIDHEDAIAKAKFFSRIFNSEHLYPKNKSALKNAISKCEFTVSESYLGSYISILSHKPSYLNIGSESSRAFFCELIFMGCEKNVVIPYTKNRTGIIKKVRAKSSDFSYIINKIKHRIRLEILKEFIP